MGSHVLYDDYIFSLYLPLPWTFLHQFLDGFDVRVSPGDVRLSDVQHHNGSLVKFDKNGISDLSESEKLKDLLDTWRDLVDTTDADNKGEFGLSGDIDVSVLFGLTLASDLETLLVSVGLGVRRSALDDSTSLEDSGSLGVLLGEGLFGERGLV